MALSGAAVAYSVAGGLILYSGIKGATLADTLKAVLAGNLTVTDTQTVDFSGGSTGTGSTSTGGTGTGTGSGSSGGSGSVASGSAAAAQAYAKSQMAKYGWTDSTNWNDLVSLWDRESGWSNTIWNGGSHAATQPGGSSGAYGIAQSLPYTKYPKAGWPPGYGGSADAQSQINWGLSYIQGRYGSPSMAWAHELANNWY